MKSHPSERGVIPLYLNLKEFRPSGTVDASAVLDFVMASLKRANVIYVERFLEQEFDLGIEEGTWLFLFDSFDEIPAVLSAVEADDVIAEYASAIYDFLTGMNACRGIIASRDFRGPKRISWTRFRILRLTGKQRKDLIEKLDLPPETEQRILSGLVTADTGVRQLADNPLFLALLCEYQRDMTEFPKSSHVVFENYVAKRFSDDSRRLADRFALTAGTVRTVAEQAAYCMSAVPGLGLSPRMGELLVAMGRAGFEVGDAAAKALDALKYLRLARPADSPGGADDGFTFAHRRFQEYFATCLVLRESFRADPLSLLTDGRWRETAVTLFQTQSETAIQPLLTQARDLLVQLTAGLAPSEEAMAGSAVAGDSPGCGSEPAAVFAWPPGSLHLLGLLQDGLPSEDHRRSAEVGDLAGRLLETAYARGQLHDRRWAVESCLAADSETAWDIIRRAFASESGWLREAAYAQAGRLYPMPQDVRQQVRGVLAQLAAGGWLRRHRQEVDAQLRRLPDPRPELLLARLFTIAPLADAILLAVLTVAVAIAADLNWAYTARLAGLALLLHAAQYVDRDVRRLDARVIHGWRYARFYGAVEALLGVDLTESSISGACVSFRLGGGASFASNVVSSKNPLSWMAFVAIIYVIMWPSAVNRADRILRNPRPFGIVALPLLWLFQSCVKAARGSWSAKRAYFIIFLALSVVVAAFIINERNNGPFSPGFTAEDTIALIVVFLVIATLAVSVGAIPYMVSRNLRNTWRDRRLLERAECGDVPYGGFAEMLGILDRFYTPRALMLFAENVRRRLIYLEHPAALRGMQAFVGMSEVWSTKNKPQTVVPGIRLEPDEILALDRWAENRWTDKRRRKRDFAVGQAVIDEIGKMVADAELARLTGLPAATGNPAEPV